VRRDRSARRIIRERGKEFPMTSAREPVLLRAEFDPKWKTYQFLKTTLVLAGSIIGLPFLPFWVLGFGQWYSRRFFESLRCTLHERSLVVGRGIYFRKERTIPLDKIQDLTLIEGPLLDRFGLCQLAIETAGQRAAAQGTSEADLVGIVGARKFRDRVLAQRDRLESSAAPRSEVPIEGADTTTALLIEIRDALQRIEGLLQDRSG
jgi:putative membrane protein